MNLKSENKSFNSIFQEITEKALQYSDKPGEYFEYLCLQIQELIGTRVVLIATKSENNTSRILSAVPSPNSEWYNQIEIQQLIEYAFQLNKTQYLDAETTNETIKKLLKNLEIENIINIPVIVAEKKMATILLLDIIDSLNIDVIIKLLENLSGVFGLVLKNSLNYLDLKEKADERAKELSTSEESLRAVFQGNFSAIAIIDADTTICRVNDAYCKLTGFSKKEIIGTSWTNQIPPPDLERLQEYNRIRKTNPAGAPEKYEFSVYRKDGNVRHCLMSVSVIEHTNKIVASFVDITERYKGEKRRKLGENRLESLLRINQFKFNNTQELLDYTLSEIITLTESQFGYIYYYNDQTKEFTLNSWSNEVMNNCSVANPQTLYHLEKTGIWGEAVRQAKPIMVNDFQTPHPLMKGLPEGHARLHKFLTIPVFNNGHIVAVVGVANKKTDYNQTDIVQLNLMMDAVWQLTEKKRAEDELMVSEKQNSSILKTALDGFWKVNMNGQFLFVNDAYCKMTGYSNEELLNMSIKDVDINDNGEDIQNRLILLVQQKSDRFSSKHRCKNGNIIDVLINISYLPDEDIIFVFVQDITKNILTHFAAKTAQNH